jgi:Na+-transporting NADH:ubiquinone oxidoreductase subunit NqrA
MEEEWRVIKDFPEYAVSNFGRVKRVTDSCRQWKAGIILKPDINRGGYVHYRLRKNGKQCVRKAHHLVLNEFSGTRPAGHQSNHLDGIKRNNDASNLVWSTASENVLHAHKAGLAHALKGEQCNLAKLHEGEVWLIKKLLHSGAVTQTLISKMFCVTNSLISQINRGIIWSHVIYP